jgi:EAL domain-containing protein (putative c-di-GMP-specific phosphodiesterase class I)
VCPTLTERRVRDYKALTTISDRGAGLGGLVTSVPRVTPHDAVPDPNQDRLLRAARAVDLPSSDDVKDALAGFLPRIVVQPILDLYRSRVCSYEALSRFPDPASGNPPAWFTAAHLSGLGAALEARAVSRAIERGRDRPAGTVLSVNVSPSVLTTPELRAVLPHDLTGLQFEVLESELVEDAAAVIEVLNRLRRRGARVAVDDVGEGYAGLQRVMEIRPDVLKLDRALIAGVHDDPARAALVDAVVRYAARTGSVVCAEGVETAEDLAALADLDVAQAQGYLVGRPSEAFEDASEESLALCRESFDRVLRSGSGWVEERRPVGQVLTALADAPDLASLSRLLDDVASLVGADLVGLSFITDDRAALRGLIPGSAALDHEIFPIDEYPVTKRVLQEREVATVSVGDDPVDADKLAVLRDLGFSAVLLTPLTVGGVAVGMIELYRLDDDPWTRASIRTARMVTAVLGPVAQRLRPSRV